MGIVSCSWLLVVGSCLQPISCCPSAASPASRPFVGQRSGRCIQFFLPTAYWVLPSLAPAYTSHLLLLSLPAHHLQSHRSPLYASKPSRNSLPRAFARAVPGILVQGSDFSLHVFSPAWPPSLPAPSEAGSVPLLLSPLTAAPSFNIHPVCLRVQIVLTISICEVLEM